MGITREDIGRLTPPERLELIAELWDSLEQERVPLTDAQMAEVDRRLATLEEDRRNAVGWDQLKADLKHRSA